MLKNRKNKTGKFVLLQKAKAKENIASKVIIFKQYDYLTSFFFRNCENCRVEHTQTKIKQKKTTRNFDSMECKSHSTLNHTFFPFDFFFVVVISFNCMSNKMIKLNLSQKCQTITVKNENKKKNKSNVTFPFFFFCFLFQKL